MHRSAPWKARHRRLPITAVACLAYVRWRESGGTASADRAAARRRCVRAHAISKRDRCGGVCRTRRPRPAKRRSNGHDAGFVDCCVASESPPLCRDGPGARARRLLQRGGRSDRRGGLTVSERRRIAAEERTFRRIVESCGCEVSPSLEFPWTPAAEAATSSLHDARCCLRLRGTSSRRRAPDATCRALFDTRGPKIC